MACWFLRSLLAHGIHFWNGFQPITRRPMSLDRCSSIAPDFLPAAFTYQNDEIFVPRDSTNDCSEYHNRAFCLVPLCKNDSWPPSPLSWNPFCSRLLQAASILVTVSRTPKASQVSNGPSSHPKSCTYCLNLFDNSSSEIFWDSSREQYLNKYRNDCSIKFTRPTHRKLLETWSGFFQVIDSWSQLWNLLAFPTGFVFS